MRNASIAALSLLLFPMVAAADPMSFNGTFVLDEERSEDIRAAFEPVIDEMNIVTRAVARRRMREGIQPEAFVRLEVTDESITVVSGDHPPAVAPSSGEEIEVSGSGGSAKLSTRIEDGVLRLKLRGSRGGFQSDYTLSADGQTLFISTTIDFSALPRPVTYRLVYRRK